MIRRSFLVLAGLLLAGPAAAQQSPLKIALIYGKTGPLEAYARQTEAGFMLGLEYATKGTMEVDGRKIQVILKDDQLKPDLAKAALEEAYGDDKVDIAVGTTSSAAALAMLPVAEEYKKLLIVEPAVADQITGDKWNRYIFRTARNSTQDSLAAAATLKDENISIATLAQDYAFGKDGIAGVAGGEQDRHVRPSRMHAVGEVAARHAARQDHVGEHEVDRRSSLENGQRLLRVAYRDHLVAEVLERKICIVAHTLVVLDQQNEAALLGLHRQVRLPVIGRGSCGHLAQRLVARR